MKRFKSDKIDEEKLFNAIKNKDVEKVKSILENSNKNKIILKLNEKVNLGYYPLYWLFLIIILKSLNY